MDRIKFETMRIESDIEALSEAIVRALEHFNRTTRDLNDAVARGWDLSCHVSNVTAAAAEMGKLTERLEGVKQMKKLIERIAD